MLENVGSVDLTSSYPTVMLSEKYPMSKGRPIAIKSMSDLKAHMKKYCLLMDIRIEGMRNKLGYESYISSSKCTKLEGGVENNGRVFSADLVEMTIVDIDLQIIEAVYEWDAIYVSNVVGFAKNYLPKPIIESILNMYEDKTTLKGVEGKEVEYLLSKGMLNSVYGMCVTDPVKDEHTYESEWDVAIVDVGEAIHKYNESKGRALFYPWGIWVTAYARRNLWSAILNVGNDYVYSDTDSIKALNFESHQPYVDAY
ncbi:DNA polymerase, partial [Herbiconiux daphne]